MKKMFLGVQFFVKRNVYTYRDGSFCARSRPQDIFTELAGCSRYPRLATWLIDEMERQALASS